MKILNSDDKPMTIDEVAAMPKNDLPGQVPKPTCGDCANCIDRNEVSGTCRPALPVWALMMAGAMFMTLKHSAEGCECFRPMVEHG